MDSIHTVDGYPLDTIGLFVPMTARSDSIGALDEPGESRIDRENPLSEEHTFIRNLFLGSL